MTYRAPIQDLTLALQTVGFEQVASAFDGFDEDLVPAVLEAAGELATGVLAPLNRVGDLQGARLENGRVRSPEGFAGAYQAFAQGGWQSLSADPAHGGQGLPRTLELAVFEMIQSANMAFALCPMLTAAAIEALHIHGTERQKRLYLTKLVSGEWTGTMQLTEPQAGSDLSAVRTVAEPDGDGGWRITGQKIYITWGDHDVAPNIVGMVLARTAGAPEGTKGLSLFLVPTYMVDEDGGIGERNDIRPVGLEHKLGIHASPTCVMAMENAHAELVGEVGQGLANMFVMMNSARIAVGVQGVAIAERAYQQALAYAQERRQGRSAWSDARPAAIIDHPDVRRMLGVTRAKIDAARLICLSAGVAGDLARHAADPEVRRKAKLREELLTPIAKAWSTDLGMEAASTGVQIHGGMGFIEETGAAQHYRDARIPPIYEGTNGIQAMDLAVRKLNLADGEAVDDMLAELRTICAEAQRQPELAGVATRLTAAVDALQRATEGLRAAEQDDVLAGATNYLRLFGDVLGGGLLTRLAAAALRRRSGGEDSAWLNSKPSLAQLYAHQVLSGAVGLAETAVGGAAPLKALFAGALSG